MFLYPQSKCYIYLILSTVAIWMLFKTSNCFGGRISERGEILWSYGWSTFTSVPSL